VALGVWALALLWAYWPALREMAARWSNDPRYSHGFLVPVFAGLVLWTRRGLLKGQEARPSWGGILLVALGVLLHLAGGFVGFQWLDAVSLVPTLAGVTVLFGGRVAWRWAWPAVVFLLFMMPLPYQLEVALAHPLQRLATTASTYALQTLGLPAVAEGNVILIEDLQIGVLEACSGLGMLVTFFALAAFVAFVSDRPLHQRLVAFASAAPIAVLMNLVRITVTGVLYVVADRELARVVFHDLAGWLMMPLALAALWLELMVLDRLIVKVPRPSGPLPVVLPKGRPALPPPALPRDDTPQPDFDLARSPAVEPLASAWRPLA
jgi:exosortase